MQMLLQFLTLLKLHIGMVTHTISPLPGSIPLPQLETLMHLPYLIVTFYCAISLFRSSYACPSYLHTLYQLFLSQAATPALTSFTPLSNLNPMVSRFNSVLPSDLWNCLAPPAPTPSAAFLLPNLCPGLFSPAAYSMPT